MKNAIETLLDSFVHDNRNNIKENGGNVAEYILTDTEALDHGWLWFLSDDEIDQYENDKEKAAELRQEIRDYVNENYNYVID